jgi:hypothetical protein
MRDAGAERSGKRSIIAPAPRAMAEQNVPARDACPATHPPHPAERGGGVTSSPPTTNARGATPATTT